MKQWHLKRADYFPMSSPSGYMSTVNGRRDVHRRPLVPLALNRPSARKRNGNHVAVRRTHIAGRATFKRICSAGPMVVRATSGRSIHARARLESDRQPRGAVHVKGRAWLPWLVAGRLEASEPFEYVRERDPRLQP